MICAFRVRCFGPRTAASQGQQLAPRVHLRKQFSPMGPITKTPYPTPPEPQWIQVGVKFPFVPVSNPRPTRPSMFDPNLSTKADAYRDKVRGYGLKNPLTLGTVCLLVGFVLGALIF